MSGKKPRLRLIAGPNGSGKSTLSPILAEQHHVPLYLKLDADEIQKTLLTDGEWTPPPGCGDLSRVMDARALVRFAKRSEYDRDTVSAFRSGDLLIEDRCRVVARNAGAVNGYTMSLLVGFLSEALIANGISFTQETVFSHVSKLDALRKAKAAGFRTYLYFVSTESPEINVDRVRARVALGGHDVPENRIRERYGKSLRNATAALEFSTRAFFFDNSGANTLYLASFGQSEGLVLQVPEPELPTWFSKNIVGAYRQLGRT